MKDIKFCPICNSKLYSVKNSFNKNIIQRQCRYGINHYVLFYSNTISNNIDWFKINLNCDNSIFIEIYFNEGKTIISCMKQGYENIRISIPKIIQPDFPYLISFKERIKMYVSLS
jgi:hypothetical protein